MSLNYWLISINQFVICDKSNKSFSRSVKKEVIVSKHTSLYIFNRGRIAYLNRSSAQSPRASFPTK